MEPETRAPRPSSDQKTRPSPDQKPELTEDEPGVEKSAAPLATQQSPDDWELLPADPNFENSTFRHYRYRGTTLFHLHLELDFVPLWAQFRGRSTDVIVASFPKSGTTWLQELVWRIVHGEVAVESGGGVPLDYRFPILDYRQPQMGNMRMAPLHEMEDPRLMKTHLPYHLLPAGVHTSGVKLLYITRDPRDVCVSYYHFARLFNPMMYRGTFAELRDRFMSGQVTYGPYREHVKGYLDHSDSDTMLCVTYEQLHQDRASIVRRVATFLGRHVTDEEVDGIVRHTSFDAMKANPGSNYRHWEKTGLATEGREGTFMRKGVVGDWRKHFTDEESDAFMKWRKEVI